MTKVLDSSVLLAGMLGEAGGDVLDAPGELFHVSAVNLSEVYTKIMERGGSAEDVDLFLRPLPLRIRRFDEGLAKEVGRLRLLTRHLGLSLGDRACLALGRRVDLPILTADAKWAQLDLGIDIRLIR
ncbi:MAG: type II toxin-antitoxin system VapC family toxin [Sphingomonas taxi]